ncbi:AMP-binding protein, partial [Streptomyces sp. NPDC020412]|uniref:AMP-binding protein n=1 Tax=Streptomyces sp. NPDC020412 TaxID=3365073 RepID=UPI0037AE3A0B
DHQHLSLTHIHNTTNHTQLFNTTTVFENYPLDLERLNDISSDLRIIGITTHGDGVTHYPLTLSVMPGERMRIRLTHRPEAFDAETVERYARRYIGLLELVARAPETPVHRVDTLLDEERAQLLPKPSGEEQKKHTEFFSDLFEARAEERPDSIAVVSGEESITYGELNTRANQLAHYLIECGVGPEDIVALALPRSLEMITAIVAVLKTGAAYLPIDPSYPADRVAFMLTDAQPAHLLTTTETADESTIETDTPIPRLHLDTAHQQLAAHPTTNPTDKDRTRQLRPDHPAYVIYTSGSTGRPKAVTVPHRNIHQLLNAAGTHFDFGPDDVWLLFHSYSFDVSVWEIAGA